MGSKRYSNKGYNAALRAEAEQKTSSHNKKITIIALACALAVIAVIVAVVVIAYHPADDTPASVDMNDIAAEINSKQVSDFTETKSTSEYVKITVKDHGDIVLRLRADVAPITVKNFQSLVAKNFYDGLTFHRVMKGFMIQGGDPKGTGTGGSDPIKGEFTANGVQNNLSHIRGVISMARLGNDMDSGSCQFFICNADDRASLDGKYASFGYVVAGMDTVDSISGVEVAYNATGSEKSVPVEKVIIEKICFVTEKK